MDMHAPPEKAATRAWRQPLQGIGCTCTQRRSLTFTISDVRWPPPDTALRCAAPGICQPRFLSQLLPRDETQRVDSLQ